MNTSVSKLAFDGDWDELIARLRTDPTSINVVSEKKHYTALHQAAWHSADPDVIGALLQLRADRRLTTSDGKTAQQIAADRHPERADLQYMLSPSPLRFSQLLRKTAADSTNCFGDYDGNRLILDRLIAIADATHELRQGNDFIQQFEDALRIAFGGSLLSGDRISFDVGEGFSFDANASFWTTRFLPLLRKNIDEAWLIPVESRWAAVSDLFYPTPSQWGLRGDLFLWLELRQLLAHAEIPPTEQSLGDTVKAAFRACTGAELTSGGEIFVPRFARGGMSSGGISLDHWSGQLLPLLAGRSTWVRSSWGRMSDQPSE